jgi:hypothetical protein
MNKRYRFTEGVKMADQKQCPACGAPIPADFPGDVFVCDSCGTALRREFIDELESAVDASEEVIDVEPVLLSEEQPVASSEPTGGFFDEREQGAQIFESTPLETQTGGSVIPPLPPVTPVSDKKKMNPWLIGAIVAVVLLCLTCICLVTVLLPIAREMDFSGIAPIAVALLA